MDDALIWQMCAGNDSFTSSTKLYLQTVDLILHIRSNYIIERHNKKKGLLH